MSSAVGVLRSSISLVAVLFFSVMVVGGLKGIGYGIDIIRSLRVCCKMITVLVIDYRLKFNVFHDTKIERKAIQFISFQLRKVGYGLVHGRAA